MAIDTVNDALDEAIRIKGQIRTAIIGKEVAVPSDTPFEDYPGKINQIKGILQTKNITPTAVGGDVLPDSGYDGFSKVTLPAEPNLVAPNISEGVSIFGVTGTAQTATFSIAQFFARTLTTLSLGVPTIGDYTFYQNTTLQSFTDTALTDLGSYAFYNCTGLTTVTTGSGLTDLEPYTFHGCTNLATFDMTHIESIGDYALCNCNKLNNIGHLHASEIGQYGCYSLASNTANGFIYDPTDPAKIDDYGFQEAKITEISGKISKIGVSALSNLNSLTKIDAEINGPIDTYGLYNNQYVKTVDFSRSDIKKLGQYAINNLGWNRSNYSSDPYMELDFRASSFDKIDQQSLGSIRYANIYLPASVKQIESNAFYNGQYINIYMQGKAPTLSSTSAFNGISNYKVYAPWTYLAGYVNGTNWSSIASNVIGYAAAGTFDAGATLPEYNGEGYAVTWYSDEAKTNQITTCPVGSPMIYCTVGSTKAKMVVVVATSGPIALTITDSNNNPVDYSLGFFLCDTNDTFTVNATTAEQGYTCYIKVGNTKITTFPYSLNIGSTDIELKATAYDPNAVNPDFIDASWDEIKLAVDTGVAASIYASYIGSTKEVVLTNGTTIHVRLANVAGASYDYASGGSTSFILEFVELYQNAQMNTSNTNNGGWNASYLRSTIISQIYDLLPSDLKAVIATVKTKSCYSGNNGTLVESEDTLFLPADPEIFGVTGYSRTEEKNTLARWQYYEDNDTPEARIKYLNGSAGSWWTRSPQQDNSNYFCMVHSNGNPSYADARYSRGVAPGFCI